MLTVDEAGIKKEALVIATEMSATAQAAADAAGELAPYYRQNPVWPDPAWVEPRGGPGIVACGDGRIRASVYPNQSVSA